ncbi:helix-turn-helix domain-containing protein [Anaerotignum sp.]
MEIHERIKEIRKDNHLTQKEFGERIGATRDVIGNIELGRVEAKEYLIKLIAKEFDVNEEWITTGAEPKYPERNMEAQLAKKIGEVIGEDDTFRKQLILTLLELSDTDWEVIKKIYHEMQKKNG